LKAQDAVNWIAEVFEEPSGRITVDTMRKEIPGWDSLGTLSLIAGLDERFDVHLSETDIDSMQRVNDILDILRRNGKLEDG
jgi:acyl carrier protein